MGPKSKDAVVSALGHIIDELLQQRHCMQRIEGKLDKADVEHQADIKQLGGRVTEIARDVLRLRNQVNGLPPTPAE
jgi:polyhydroxyalkanoate synthesis regulator phasin